MRATTHVDVTRAQFADVDLVAPLFDAYRQFYGAASDLAAGHWFVAQRLLREESVVLLARRHDPSDGRRATADGFAQLYRSFSSVAMKRLYVLNDLFVVETRRGRGVGRRLVDAAADHATATGAAYLQIATQRTNARALGLYESMGFVRDTEFMHLSLTLPLLRATGVAGDPHPSTYDSPTNHDGHPTR